MSSFRGDLLKPNEFKQRESFCNAIAELFWKVFVEYDFINIYLKSKVGDEKYAVLAVVGNTLSFDPPSTFSRDEVTERVN